MNKIYQNGIFFYSALQQAIFAGRRKISGR
jgi:hypothetical protein